MFPQQDLLPNQYLLPLRMLMKMRAGSLKDPPDQPADYGSNIPLEAIAPLPSFLSLLSHEAELESWERLEVAVSSLLLEQCLLSLGWEQSEGLALRIFR